jgi:hypothetical protein
LSKSIFFIISLIQNPYCHWQPIPRRLGGPGTTLTLHPP